MTRDERVKFAEILLGEAEHSSEVALRTSLSRAYYAVHHLGIELTGSSNHALIRDRLSALDVQMGKDYGRLLLRRQNADYNPILKSFEPEGLPSFQEATRSDLLLARTLVERMKVKIYGSTP